MKFQTFSKYPVLFCRHLRSYSISGLFTKDLLMFESCFFRIFHMNPKIHRVFGLNPIENPLEKPLLVSKSFVTFITKCEIKNFKDHRKWNMKRFSSGPVFIPRIKNRFQLRSYERNFYGVYNLAAKSRN